VSTRETRGEERPSASITVEERRSSLRRVRGADPPFTAASALCRTVPQSRQAGKYRVGRVYLAGDAGRVFSAGGSSLNVGLQDALHRAQHLGALLSLEPAGFSTDSYHAVRRPAGEAALRHTRAQAALGKKGNEDLRLILGGLLRNRRTSRRLARLLENG